MVPKNRLRRGWLIAGAAWGLAASLPLRAHAQDAAAPKVIEAKTAAATAAKAKAAAAKDA